jgi:hypothetical protein
VGPDELFEGLPARLSALTREPAFEQGGDSFAVWWTGDRWASARDPRRGGMDTLLAPLDGKPASYARHSKKVLDAALPRAALDHLYEGRPITAAWLESLELDASRGFALARALRLPTSGPSPRMTRRRAPTGDAEFKVVRDGDATLLVVGGRVLLERRGPELYTKAIEAVRALLKGGS